MKNQVKKASQDMHICWEKFSSCQNITNLQEPSILDKLAYNMLSSRQHYQQLLADYINSLREVNTVKKVKKYEFVVKVAFKTMVSLTIQNINITIDLIFIPVIQCEFLKHCQHSHYYNSNSFGLISLHFYLP